MKIGLPSFAQENMLATIRRFNGHRSREAESSIGQGRNYPIDVIDRFWAIIFLLFFVS